ncbi:hypothetical protein [Streptomyces fuscigenes]|uniref:hypothetical protein n=1 Tax=Streptomyces fuscigenes TaxID=1528880 RepID=UPI001F1B0912|nr:hypothetical protein [Streptomyces fuscigenes]MCF3962617.1 hypothetical protein [Streptomyces fuscigenes]
MGAPGDKSTEAARSVLPLADAGEAADLAAFLGRLLHYDRAAAVRLQAGDGVLAVFGRPPSFEVVAIRTVRLRAPGGPDAAGAAGTGPARATVRIDVTVSAGDLLEGVAEDRAEVTVPDPVTGPPWAGVLPPRGGWRPVPGLPGLGQMARSLAGAVAEFRRRDEELPQDRRTRDERDRIGREIWSRTVGETTLPLRAVHAARSVGFLRPPGAAPGAAEPALFASGAWLRLRTAYGSVAVRVGEAGLAALPGLSVVRA